MRRFLQDLAVLAAVTAAGGFALIRAPASRPLSPALMLPPVVLDHAATPWDDAMNVLRTAPTFASASIGYGGIVPDAVVAWRTVLGHPMAVRFFLKLMHTATPEGRLYALAGLRALDPSLFRSAAEPHRRSRAPVKAMAGCLGFSMATADLVYELDRGMWIGEFVSASRSRYFGDLPWPAGD